MISSEKPVHALGAAFVSAVALAGFLLILVESGNFGAGARLFPRLLGIVGGLSAAVVLVQSCLRVIAERRRPDPRRAGDPSLKWHDIVISYVGPPIYAVMLYALGFWIASIVGLAGLLILLGERRPRVVLALTAGTLLAIYLMFEFSFGIQMPKGVLLRA
jgi:tripartite tricarboxylate transporter TctB family protein